MKNNSMKNFKILIAICLMIFSISLCSCGNKKQIQTANTMEYKVSSEMSNLENAENLSDETLKALSIIIRTKLYNGESISILKNDNSNNFKQSKISSDSTEKSNNLGFGDTIKKNAKDFEFTVNKTSNQVLSGFVRTTKNNFEQLPKNIIITTDSKSYTWQKVIKKSELLRFLAKKNISLANISNFKTNTDENSNIISIVIAGKEIDFSEIKSEFNLPSSKISGIKNNISDIFISGIGIDYPNVFDIKVSESLANSGLCYEQILSFFFDSYNIINLAKN